MGSFQEAMEAYRRLLAEGTVQEAYRGLMEYLMGLRTHFMKTRPEYGVSGSIYQGYMDMTYFAVVPESLKERRLKVAIVFLYEAFRFEVWLSGANRQVQAAYYDVIRESDWDKYRLVPQEKWADSIIEGVLVADPDFSDLDALTRQIESGTATFIEDVERFLSEH